jgi:hypothetical protein
MFYLIFLYFLPMLITLAVVFAAVLNPIVAKRIILKDMGDLSIALLSSIIPILNWFFVGYVVGCYLQDTKIAKKKFYED